MSTLEFVLLVRDGRTADANATTGGGERGRVWQISEIGTPPSRGVWSGWPT